VLEYAIRKVAGESHIQPSRLVRHDVGPVGLHKSRKIVTLESSRADF
jgi:hypothetical protein